MKINTIKSKILEEFQIWKFLWKGSHFLQVLVELVRHLF